MSFDVLFSRPMGRTSRAQYMAALAVFLAATAFYVVLVKGRNGQWCQLTLLYPAFMLLARRLHDMGKTAWLLAVPLALWLAHFWLLLYSPHNAAEPPVTWAALAVSAAIAIWGLVDKGQAEANRFGEPAAA